MVLGFEHGGGRGKKWPWKGHDQVILNTWIASPFFVNLQPSANLCRAVAFPL